MHHVVLERMGLVRPSQRHTAHHRDGCGLNNRRSNLRWRTPKEQMRENRIRYALAAGLAPYEPMLDVPY
jgi:hypothetical protein